MKTIPLLITIGISFILTSCGAGELKKTSAYGGLAYKVKCTNTPESCLEEAYKACKGGVFTTLYSDSHAGGFLADIIPAQTTWYALTFKCGGIDTKPTFAWRGTSTRDALQSMKNLSESFKSNTTSTNCYKFGNSINCTTR